MDAIKAVPTATMKIYRAKLKTRKQITAQIPREQQGWWADVCPGATLELRDATTADLARCLINEGQSRDPADYLCETTPTGALVHRVAVSTITELEVTQGADHTSTPIVSHSDTGCQAINPPELPKYMPNFFSSMEECWDHAVLTGWRIGAFETEVEQLPTPSAIEPDWRAIAEGHALQACALRDELDALKAVVPGAQSIEGAEFNGWKEAAIAWSVCASIHAKYGKGKDALFKTRNADYLKHADDARARVADPGKRAAQSPANPTPETK